LAGLFCFLGAGVIFGVIPMLSAAAVMMLPWVSGSVRTVERDYENPQVFLAAVNTAAAMHVVVAVSLGIGFLWG